MIFTQLSDLLAYFDEDTARQYLMSCRWPQGVQCPYCQSKRVYPQDGRYMCANSACRKKFSTITDTFMEKTKAPVSLWLALIWIMQQQPNISGMQVQRWLSIPQKTAWRMMTRIRYSITSPLYQSIAKSFNANQSFKINKMKQEVLNLTPDNFLFDTRGPVQEKSSRNAHGLTVAKSGVSYLSKLSSAAIRSNPDKDVWYQMAKQAGDYYLLISSFPKAGFMRAYKGASIGFNKNTGPALGVKKRTTARFALQKVKVNILRVKAYKLISTTVGAIEPTAIMTTPARATAKKVLHIAEGVTGKRLKKKLTATEKKEKVRIAKRDWYRNNRSKVAANRRAKIAEKGVKPSYAELEAQLKNMQSSTPEFNNSTD